MNALGISTPCCGWRARANASAPTSCFLRRSIFGWYQNSIQLLLKRLIEIDAAGDRRRFAELELLQDLQDCVGVERLLEDRQHLQVLLLADALDMREHGRAAVAHELHGAAIAALAEHADALDRFGGFERDVEENEIGLCAGSARPQRLAVGEFLGIDSGAVQDERQEMPDARIRIDDKAERRARARCLALFAAPGAAA